MTEEKNPKARREAYRPRLAAALALKDVLGGGRALDEALLQRLSDQDDPRDQGLAREIAYGCLRYLPRLRFWAARLLQRPMKAKDLDVECLLWVGLYQLAFLRVPSHAAVSETVAAVNAFKRKSWARGFLNGVLRNFDRRHDEMLAAVQTDEAARLCFPDWLSQRLKQAWPEEWERLAEASNQHPPMVLRVNATHGGRGEYTERLAAEGMSARPLAHAADALELERPVDVGQLPGFGNGDVSVQDGAAQLAARLLDAEPGHSVLDACAAPGGKTAHILELDPGLQLSAVDVSAERLQPLRQNLERLGLRARVLAADLREPEGAWADRLYERILLDAPCSASGVIRRHPDIKWLRRPEDIQRLVQEQAAILDSLWRYLAADGILVYATCSLFPEENTQQMQAFLQRTDDAEELPVEAAWGRACAHGRQILTGDGGMDGFYYARLVKNVAERADRGG